jgi:carboxyl-terminal processing protease
MNDLDRDWFSVYINSITSGMIHIQIILHLKKKERFDVSISGKLEGIGARLKKNDFTEISELISGGPAWSGKQLEGDLVMKVAQGNGVPVDVVGMRDDVKKIKGPKGTEVRLTVKKMVTIKFLIRDVVEIEETYAKSSVLLKWFEIWCLFA